MFVTYLSLLEMFIQYLIAVTLIEEDCMIEPEEVIKLIQKFSLIASKRISFERSGHLILAKDL